MAQFVFLSTATSPRTQKRLLQEKKNTDEVGHLHRIISLSPEEVSKMDFGVMITCFRLTTIVILVKCALSVFFQGCPEGHFAFPYLKTNSFPSHSTTIGLASESGGNTTFFIVAAQGNGELKRYVNGSSFSTRQSGLEEEWYSTSVLWETSTGEHYVFIDGQHGANGNMFLGCQIPSTGTLAIGQLMVRILCFSFTTATYCILLGPNIFLIL